MLKKVIDFGAGYGRVGIVLNSLFPNASFKGHEILKVRSDEANRLYESLNLKRCKIVNENVLVHDFEIESADLYFIYDFSEIQHVEIILRKLLRPLSKKRFFIVARGEGVRSLIQLEFPELWMRKGAIHRKEWSLYSSEVDLSS